MADEHVAVVLDVETTMNCPVGNSKSNPFWPDNEVVLAGWKFLPPHLAARFREGVRIHNVAESNKPIGVNKLFLIGSNIAFDIHHCLRECILTKEQLAVARIWDIQLAEYLLTGQTERYASLDDMAGKYGGEFKDGRVAAIFDSGKGADHVPKDMLTDYLKVDLKNTKLIFYKQWADAEEKGMLPLIWSQMDARLATIEMVHNGMAVDTPFLKRRTEELIAETETIRVRLLEAAEVWAPGLGLDPTNPNHLSLLLFGGDYKTTENVIVGKYKNGKDKWKLTDTLHKVAARCAPLLEWVGKNGKAGTGDDVLDYILARNGKASTLGSFVADVQTYREKTKQLTTYYQGIDNLTMPDGKIHQNINHTATATGRLSQNEPNLQNVTDGKKGDIKQAFVSRWGDAGSIVVADYKQLEMVMLAVLSEDTQLMADIRDGVDMHDALFHEMFGRAMKKEERTQFKRCSFALVYGAGAGGIAAQTGVQPTVAQKFIRTFYNRYPGVKRWHEEVAKEVEDNRVYTGTKDKETGLPIGYSTLISEFSGRRYTFKEYPLSEKVKAWKKKDVGFSPTEIKNYPVQGGATGDIVPLVCGRVYRVLRNSHVLKDKCLMVNTVHDNIMFDVHNSVLPEAISLIRQTMERAPLYIKQTLGTTFPLPLRVEISSGPNWLQQETV